MRTRTEFQDHLLEMLADLQDKRVLWQLGAIALSLLLAWWANRLLLPRISQEREGAWKLGAAGLQRVAFPLIALVLVLLARAALKTWLPVHLLDLAVPLLLTMAIVRVVVYMLRQVFASSGALAGFERTTAWVIWVGFAFYITGFADDLGGILDSIAIHLGKTRVSLLLILQAVFTIAATLLITLWIGSALEQRIMGVKAMDLSLRVVLTKLIRVGLIVLGVLIALPLVGIDVTVLSVFGGALGVGLGLGLQKIASNYVSGFIILLDRSVRIGDTLSVDNRAGQVTEISTRYVVLKSADGTEAIIPNDTLVTSTVINHSYTDRKVRLAVPVQVSYASDLEKAIVILREAARVQPRVLAQPEPAVAVKEFGDNGILLELGMWINDPEEGRLNLVSEVNLEIWRQFRLQGIEIPYPQREVRFVGSLPAARTP
jgi:small-conductance mechanosensitive channel